MRIWVTFIDQSNQQKTIKLNKRPFHVCGGNRALCVEFQGNTVIDRTQEIHVLKALPESNHEWLAPIFRMQNLQVGDPL